MKLQDFIIGVFVFILFTSIILSASFHLYQPSNLNVTMDSETNETIYLFANEVGVPEQSINGTANREMQDLSSTIRSKTHGGEDVDTGAETSTDASLMKSSIRAMAAIPKTYSTIQRVLGIFTTRLGLDTRFVTFFVSSIVIIVALILLGSILRSKLQS